MRRWYTRSWLRTARPLELAAAALLAVVTPGCVSYTSYDTLSDETEQLREEKERLEAASEGSDQARVAALEQAEDLREERDKLALEVKKLSRKVGELEVALAEHERAREAATAQRSAQDARFGPVRAEFAPEIEAGRIVVIERSDGLRLLFSEDLVFSPGTGELSPNGRILMQRLALRVRDEDQRVEVEGGADTPQLRLQRGASLMRALAAGGVPDEQLRAGSFLDEEASDPDATPGRPGAEVRLLPNLGSGPGTVASPVDLPLSLP